MDLDSVKGRRILILIGSLAGGGAERSAALLATLWAEERREVAIVVLGAQKSDEYHVHPAVTRYWLGLGHNSNGVISALHANYERVRGIRRTIQNYKPDTVIAFMETANVLLAIASIGLSVRTIGCERTYPPHSTINRIWRFLRNNCYGFLDVIVAQTETTAEWIRENTRSRHVVAIPNAIQWPMAVNISSDDEPRKLAAGRKIIVAAGRLHPLKGFGHLISAFAKVSQTRPDWCLIILGEGPQRVSLADQISRLDLKDRAFLPGRRENIAAWFSSADIFALTSSHEGFPNVLLEAMACGLPPVSFDCDVGPRAIIRHGQDGILVTPCDAIALTEALSPLMDNAALRMELGKFATSVRERFATARILELWDGILNADQNSTSSCR